MQPLDNETNLLALDQEIAALVMETIPQVMRYFRAELRRQGSEELSVPHFRTLFFLNSHEGASLSDVADHLGITLPSASKLMDTIVRHGYVERTVSSSDRRRSALVLTTLGRVTLQQVRRDAMDRLVQRFEELSLADRQAIQQAMCCLQRLFTTKCGGASEKRRI